MADRHYRHRDTSPRSRSYSPPRSDRRNHHHHRHHRHRDHRDHKHDHHHKKHHGHHSHHHDRRHTPQPLPFHAHELSKSDLPYFKPLFATYLDIQKGINLATLNEEEEKGRWKSFVARWNRGELAEGWYDPETLRKARRSIEEEGHYYLLQRARASPEYGSYDYGYDDGSDTGKGKGKEKQVEVEAVDDRGRRDNDDEEEEEEEEEEDYGPELPLAQIEQQKHQHQHSGPTIPSLEDLQVRRETQKEETTKSHEDSKSLHRAKLTTHRNEAKELQDFVAPRAEPGTHERRVEKRQERAAANRDFAAARRGGSPEGAPDEELMGSGENELEALKKAREKETRKKNDREIRREEILRARAAEREERVRKYRQKEDETIGWLKALAKQRFG